MGGAIRGGVKEVSKGGSVVLKSACYGSDKEVKRG